MGIGVAGVDDLARRGQKAVTWLRTAGAFVAWSPDGRTILTQQFGATSDNLALVDATSRAVRAVTLHGAGDLFDPMRPWAGSPTDRACWPCSA